MAAAAGCIFLPGLYIPAISPLALIYSAFWNELDDSSGSYCTAEVKIGNSAIKLKNTPCPTRVLFVFDLSCFTGYIPH
jgi:hypothetical protein